MVLKKSQERVKTLLKDTITLLCKNGLEFKKKFSIEALIGVTLDDDEVFLISMNELVKTESFTEAELSLEDPTPDTTTTPSKKSKRRHDYNSGSAVKNEPRSPSNQESAFDTQPEDLWGGGEPPSLSPSALGDDSSNLTTDEPPAKRKHRRYTGGEHDEDSNYYIKNEAQDEDEDAEDIVIVKEETGDSFFQSCAKTNEYETDIPQFMHTPQGTGVSGNPAWRMSQSGAQNFQRQYQPRGPSATVTSDGSMPEQSPGQFQDQQQVWSPPIHPCSTCGKLIKTRRGLRQHENWHKGIYRFKCKICDKGFMSGTSLRGHMAHHHTGIKDFKCDVCGKEFAYKYYLKSHMQEVHDISLEIGLDGQ